MQFWSLCYRTPKIDMMEVKERLGFLEDQGASISRRLDRVGGDVS